MEINSTQHQCANCGISFHGEFCNNCGQKVIQRFTAIYLWQRLREDLLGIESGFIHTFKELWINPGKMISNYIKGATIQYYSPLKYLILWTAAYLILIQLIGRAEQNPHFLQDLIAHSSTSFSIESFVDFYLLLLWFMQQKSDFYFLGIIPFLALSGYLFFKNKNLNLTEMMIFYTYYYGQFAFCAMVGNLTNLVPGWRETKASTVIISFLVYFLFFRMQKQFFNESWKITIVKGVAILFLGSTMYWSILFLSFIGYKYLFY